jgi:AbrB family looped-hinge helix DNA binding protein
VALTDIATVTSKKMVTIPARIRKKYGLHEGRKVRFVEVDGNLVLVPVLSLRELHGFGREHLDELKEAARELDTEHREEGKAPQSLKN